MFKNEPNDAIFFLPGEKPDQVQIEAATYRNPGEDVGGSVMGKTYHVILFKEDDSEKGVYDVDRFEAIFCDPLEYISGLIPQHWFGVIARKTTTSDDFIEKTFAKISES